MLQLSLRIPAMCAITTGAGIRKSERHRETARRESYIRNPAPPQWTLFATCANQEYSLKLNLDLSGYPAITCGASILLSVTAQRGGRLAEEWRTQVANW